MTDELRVKYPCDGSLHRVGRVAVVGLLLRLRTPMMAVEQFRSELDKALKLAAGKQPDPGSMMTVVATWDKSSIRVEISGPASSQVLTRARIKR